MLSDFRYALRMLAKNPGFTAVAVLTLALGIGANTAIFSVVNAVLLRPLSYKDPGRLIMIWSKNRMAGGADEDLQSYPNFQDYKNRNHVFEDMAAYHLLGFNITGADGPQIIGGVWATASLFPVLGAKPFLG